MVIWRTPRSRWSVLVCMLALSGGACTTIDGPTADNETWKSTWKNRAEAVADGAGAGATAVGDSLGTAYTGLRDGFEDPANDAYGEPPRAFVKRIQRHMVRFEGVPEAASFQFGKPVRGYMNAGILAGGGIQWQGWLVDVQITTQRFGQDHTKPYVVRMTDGEVEEVHDGRYTHALRRVGAESAPAKASPTP